MDNIILKKFNASIKKNGLVNTAKLTIKYIFNKFKHNNFLNKVLVLNSNEEKFTWIYHNKYWVCKESVSGTGSTIEYTKNLRANLPILFREFNIRTVFDAPCGDFNWMHHLLKNVEITYTGGDIVKPLVDSLNLNYSKHNISFIHIDLTRDVPPKCNLMICRDCLIHLSYEDTKLLLNNFLQSGTNYLLTTTHVNINNSIINKNILTGDYRMIDLFSTPYNLPNSPKFIIEDWIAPDPQRVMCLWSREQISNAIN
jgi:hypothetical protein